MTIMNTNQPWVNADGLAVKFPKLELEQGKGGEICSHYSPKVLAVDIDYTTLTTNVSAAPDSATEVVILDYNLYLPAGAVIEKIEVFAATAWTSAGDGFKLNVGTVRKTDMTTIVDADGLIDSLAETAMDTPNTLVRIDHESNATYAGALLDDATQIATYDVVLCAWWETEAPTAGTAKIRIFYH